MENKNLILIIVLVVVVFLAGGFILLEKQRTSGMVEKSSRLILNNPEVEIIEGENVQSLQYFNGSLSPDCCTESWQIIRLDKITSADDSRVCLFVHPRSNATVNLTYKNIKLKKTINFSTAISDVVITGFNSPVFMDVYINNVLLERITQPDAKGWLNTNINTEQYENKLSDVKLVVSSDNNAQRHFCFDAEIAE
jgi:hypothetical protein